MNSLPPLPYLVDCRTETLQTLELKALDAAAQHMKAAKAEWEQARAHTEAAGVYRWLIENREELICLSKMVVDGRQGMLRFEEFSLRRTA
jgi:hypothetical protein